MADSQSERAFGEENAYFDYLPEWTRRKHKALKGYAESFAKIINNLYSVDLFAGRGEHRDGNAGSPLVTAELAQGFWTSGKPFRLRCINVELNAAHFEHLEELTRKFPKDIVRNYQGSFAGYRTLILRQIGANAALFFLDPFGVKGLEWNILQPILDRRYTTELLINFNMPYARRLAGFLNKGTPDAKAKIKELTSVLGTEEWMQCVSTYGPEHTDEQEASLGDCITEIYKRQLRTKFDHVYHFPVRSIESGLVKYHLIFATRSCKGVVVMSNVLGGIEREYQAEYSDQLRLRTPQVNAVQLSMFGEPVAQSDLPETRLLNLLGERELRIRQAMIDALQREPAHRMPYLRLLCTVAERCFGQAPKRTYSEQLRFLRTHGQLMWEGRESKLPDETDMVRLAEGQS